MLLRLLVIFAIYSTCVNLSSFAAQNNSQDHHFTASNSNVITKLVIEGNLRMEKAAIENYLELNKHTIYSENFLDFATKKLFATGFFSDIKISFNAGILNIKFKENPLINQVSFEGNKKITKNSLLESVALKNRSIYSKAKLQQDINKITDLYHRQGCYGAIIEPKMIELDNNRINLVFEINEGPKTLVKNIYFVGNKKFSNNDLKSIINTKETKWYKFWSNADNYDADLLEIDKEVLKRYYNSQGYFDCNIISATAELSPERDAFIVTFSLEEGDKYNFGKIAIETKLETNIDKLHQTLTTKTGDVFDINLVDETVLNLIQSLSDQSFAFVNVRPLYGRKHEEKLIDVIYEIEETKKAYINKINISGNLHTSDKVIRREFKLAEGDPFNASLLDRSEQNLRDLDYFAKVELERYPSETSPGNVDIDVKVEEKSTVKLNLGGGIITEGKKISPVINVTLNDENIFGSGRMASISLEKSMKSQGAELSLSDPYFLDKNLFAGIDFNFSQNNKVDLFPYKSNKIGTTLHLGFRLTDNLSYSTRYSLSRDIISKISPDTSELIKLQKGTTITSLVGHGIVYNRTNSRIKPTKGYWLKLDEAIAGLGGDSKFINHEAGAGYYRPIYNKDLVLSISTNIGHSLLLANKKNRINPYEAFNIGGSGSYGLRGFESGGIGPRTRDVNRDSIGGRFYYKSTTELTIPLGLSKSLDITGLIFFDAGSLQEPNLPKEYLKNKKDSFFSDKTLRLSTGFGFVWVGPIGPVKIYIPFVLKKQPYDMTQKFHVEFFSMAF